MEEENSAQRMKEKRSEKVKKQKGSDGGRQDRKGEKKGIKEKGKKQDQNRDKQIYPNPNTSGLNNTAFMSAGVLQNNPSCCSNSPQQQ